MAFVSVGMEIKLPPGNGPYCFRVYGQIYRLVSPLYPNEAYEPECGQLYISISAEATPKGLENQTKDVWQ
jgi:hypothetical protein